jgi:TRAP-type C4-dicarboxylate transport system permease small subunit
MQWLQKTSDVLNKVALIFLGIALAIMTVVVFAQVIFRMIGASLPWSEEFARYTMVFLTYIGASVGVKHKSHISVEAVVGILPSKLQAVAEVLIDILLMVVFYILIRYGMKVVGITMYQQSPAMKVKMGYMYSALVIGAAFMTVHTLNNIVWDVKKVLAKGEAIE